MRSYVHSLGVESLPWMPIFNTGVKRRVYNTDPKDQSFTSIILVPKGWVGPSGAHYHTSFEEGYILEGSLTLDGNDYLVPGSYLYRPGMIVHGWTELSEESSLIIVKRGGISDIISVGLPLYDYEYPFKEVHDGRPHIVHLKTSDMTWKSYDHGVRKYYKKTLSINEDNGDSTYLLSLPSGWNGKINSSNKRDLECIIIDGNLELDDGTTMNRLDYLYRPPKEVKAPIVLSQHSCTLLAWETTLS